MSPPHRMPPSPTPRRPHPRWLPQISPPHPRLTTRLHRHQPPLVTTTTTPAGAAEEEEATLPFLPLPLLLLFLPVTLLPVLLLLGWAIPRVGRAGLRHRPSARVLLPRQNGGPPPPLPVSLPVPVPLLPPRHLQWLLSAFVPAVTKTAKSVFVFEAHEKRKEKKTRRDRYSSLLRTGSWPIGGVDCKLQRYDIIQQRHLTAQTSENFVKTAGRKREKYCFCRGTRKHLLLLYTLSGSCKATIGALRRDRNGLYCEGNTHTRATWRNMKSLKH